MQLLEWAFKLGLEPTPAPAGNVQAINKSKHGGRQHKFFVVVVTFDFFSTEIFESEGVASVAKACKTAAVEALVTGVHG